MCVFTQMCVPRNKLNKTYCAFTGVNGSDGERICHARFDMFF